MKHLKNAINQHAARSTQHAARNMTYHGGHFISKIKFKDIPGLSRIFSAFFKDLEYPNSRIFKD